MLSLETCMKLKEAGWPQDYGCLSVFAYVPSHHFSDEGKPVCIFTPPSGIAIMAICPSLEELLEAILLTDECDGHGLSLYRHKWTSGWEWRITVVSGIYDEIHPSPSEAAVALWLKLKGAKDA